MNISTGSNPPVQCNRYNGTRRRVPRGLVYGARDASTRRCERRVHLRGVHRAAQVPDSETNETYECIWYLQPLYIIIIVLIGA